VRQIGGLGTVSFGKSSYRRGVYDRQEWSQAAMSSGIALRGNSDEND
jgi:hypothetical protein